MYKVIILLFLMHFVNRKMKKNTIYLFAAPMAESSASPKTSRKFVYCDTKAAAAAHLRNIIFVDSI